MGASEEVERYVQSCGTEFWQGVFHGEIEYLLRGLEGTREVLSVGCGPATIERELSLHGFQVTGLDVSAEALDRAPDLIRTVVARAEHMPLPDGSFDAVVYVASLQFLEDYRQALRETARVLRPRGRLIAMLLNPESPFFRIRLLDPNSYVSRIKHADIREIEMAAAADFELRTEYFLEARGDGVAASPSEGSAVADALLYVLSGTKKPRSLQS